MPVTSGRSARKFSPRAVVAKDVAGLDERTRDALFAAIAGDGEIAFDEPMQRHTTLRIGGPVDAWVTPRSIDAVLRVRRACLALGIASRGFGSGSNLLVRDGGIRGVAIHCKHLAWLREIDGNPAELDVGAGISTGKLLSHAMRGSLAGVEFLGGVPGSVGGGLVMNAGTYLGEFTDVTQEVTSVDEEGKLITRTHDECGFAYRSSKIPASDVVVSARISLHAGDKAKIEQSVASLKARRKEREPTAVANAGSFFKNPPGDFAGRLIESTGMKGLRIGDAEVSPVHANWIVNHGNARAQDVLELIARVRDTVAEQHGVTLELEVKLVGEDI